jgi:hypothetical protein
VLLPQFSQPTSMATRSRTWRYRAIPAGPFPFCSDIAELESDTLEIFLGTGDAAYATPLSIGTGPSPSGLLAANLHGQTASAGLPDIVAPDNSFGVISQYFST